MDILATAVYGIDLGTFATEAVTNIGTVAAAGLGIFGALYGLRLIVKAFSRVAK